MKRKNFAIYLAILCGMLLIFLIQYLNSYIYNTAVRDSKETTSLVSRSVGFPYFYPVSIEYLSSPWYIMIEVSHDEIFQTAQRIKLISIIALSTIFLFLIYLFIHFYYRKKNNEKLNEYQFRLKSLFENMVEGVALNEIVYENDVPVNYRIIETNKKYDEILSFESKSAIGKLATEMYGLSEAPLLKEFYSVVSTNKPIVFETYFENPGMYFHVSVAPWGKNGFATIFQDITAIKTNTEALKNSEEKFAKAFYSSPASISIIGLDDLVYVDVNETFEEFTQYKKDEVVGKSVYDINIYKNMNDLLRWVDYLKQGKSVRNELIEVITKSGLINTSLVSAELINLNNLPCILVTSVNLTEYYKALNDLKEREEILVSIFNATPLGMAIIKDRIMTKVNNSIFKILGYTEDELIGQSTRIFYQNDLEFEQTGKYLQSQMIEKGVGICETIVITKNGELKEVLMSLSPLDLTDFTKGYTATMLDITWRKQIENELLESEKYFRTLIETAPIGIAAVDTFGKLSYASTKIYEMFELPANISLSDKYISNWLKKEDIEDVHRRLFEVTSLQRNSIPSEFQLTKNNGELFWAEVIASPIINEDGKSSGLFIFINDISKRKINELKIKESVSLLQSTLEATSNAILVVSPEGKLTEYNRKFLEMWGLNEDIMKSYDDNYVISLVLNKLKHPDIFIQKVRYLYEFPEETSSDVLEFLDGRIILRYSQPQFIDNLIVGRVWSFLDITEQKNAEKLLFDSERRFKTIFEFAPGGIFVMKEFTIIDCNPNTTELFNADYNEIVGKTPIDFSPEYQPDGEKSTEKSNKIIKKVLSGNPQNFEWVHTRKNSRKTFTAEVKLNLLIVDGEPLILALIQDITTRIKHDKAMSKSQQQLKKFAAHIQNIREEERIFISRELHDNLGQSLTALKIDLFRLNKKTNNPDNPSLLDFHSKTTEVLSYVDSIIQSVRQISRELRPAILDDIGLLAAIESVVKEFEAKTEIQCEFICNIETLELPQSEKVGVFRIVQESLTNVYRHANASKVVIKIQIEKKSIVFEIIDNGIGIKNTKVNASKSLGILSMNERAALFGGKISLKGEPGKGTKVKLIIPQISEKYD